MHLDPQTRYHLNMAQLEASALKWQIAAWTGLICVVLELGLVLYLCRLNVQQKAMLDTYVQAFEQKDAQ